jgi:hypothetical protein
MLRKGIFEIQIPVYAAGGYSVRVTDPITEKATELRFEVAPLSAERIRGVRDERLQTELARQTGGRTYDLTTVHQLPDEMTLSAAEERLTRSYGLWTTPLWFGAVIVLMLGEWSLRKMIRLS